MKAIAIVIVLLAGVVATAQSKPDENAIRRVLDDEITTWNQGDTDGYSKHFAADGTTPQILESGLIQSIVVACRRCTIDP